jgi:beta-lactamase class A
MNYMTTKRFTLKQLILIALLLVGLSVTLTSFLSKKHFQHQVDELSKGQSCAVDIKRIEGFSYIKPLLFVDDNCEAEHLMGVKQKINSKIEQYKAQEGVSSASVYLREYKYSGWIAINDTDKYDPGSLFKVPVMMAILKMDDQNPGFLNKQIPYTKAFVDTKSIAYQPSQTIQLGKSYSIKELMTYMIKYSDNQATILLESQMKNEELQNLFSVVGLEVPNAYARQYQFTAKDYSLFMRAIFNASYLSIKNSEIAGELLGQSQFKDGLLKGLPATTKMAHKFGESGNNGEKQLHESGIIYLENHPYLLTVMTRGNDMKKLSNLIAEISSLAHEEMSLDE